MIKILISCFILLIMAAALALNPQLNQAIFNSINNAFRSQIFWMTITNTGLVVFVGCLLFIALRNSAQLLTNALLCAIAAHYSIKFFKSFFAKLRPEHTPDLSQLITLGPALNIDNYSMPSGHTATAFIAAMFIVRGHSLHGWRLWMIFFYAALIGISRVAVGAHWPSDILAGAAIGILLGRLFSYWTPGLQHKFLVCITYLLYLPFFVFAIWHLAAINSLSTALSEGIIVAVGSTALIVWISVVKREFAAN